MHTNKIILIVDNDPEWIDILKPLLEEVEFVCLTSSNYIEAIKVLESSHPSVLVLDLKLADGNFNENEWDGWQLAKAAKEQHIPSIIVSGYPRDDRFHRAYLEFNVRGFFDKSRFFDRKSMFIDCVRDAINSTKKRLPDAPRPRKPAKDSDLLNEKGKALKQGNVFISYSHKDREWLDRFKTNLKVLEKSKGLNVWDDTQIKSGAAWRDEIGNALSSAKVALLLVTPDFLASDFINNTELPALFKAAKKKGLQILWVAVKPSMCEDTYIWKFQAANTPSKPLASLTKSKADQEIIQICKKVKEALQ